MTRHAYLEEINRTLWLHQTDISSKRSAQRQYNKRDQILIKCTMSQCYVQLRFKLTSKLLKSEVQTATAIYTLLFYENVTSVIVISSALFRIYTYIRILTNYFYCSQSSHVSVFSARNATDKYRRNIHFSIKLCAQYQYNSQIKVHFHLVNTLI